MQASRGHLLKSLDLAGPLAWFEGVSIALLLGAAPAAAQSSGQVFANPPTLQERGASGLSLNRLGPGAPPAPTGRRDFDLTVAYTDNKIWNPATQRFDKVHLRSYTGEGVNPDAPFVAPAIEVTAGSDRQHDAA